jgi:hypothetical protein
VNDVRGAVSKYAQVADRESAKIQLEEFLAAAGKLEKTFAPVGSIQYLQLYNSIAAQAVLASTGELACGARRSVPERTREACRIETIT